MGNSSLKTDKTLLRILQTVLPWKRPNDCSYCEFPKEGEVVLAIGVYIYDLGTPEMCPSEQTIASVCFSPQLGWTTHITDKPFCVYYWTEAPVKQEGSRILPY